MSVITVVEESTTLKADETVVTLISEGIQGPPGPPGPVGPKGDSTKTFVSADPDNRLTTGSDDGLFVPEIVIDPLAYYILAKA